MEEWKEYKLRDLFLEIKSGDWGKDSPQYEYVESVACLRGADIPSTNKQQISKAPTRYISARNFAAKSLKIGDLVIEISGGSPTQSTGRVAYISQSVLNLYKSRVICSNFCKVLQVNTDVIDSNFAYYLWNYLYKKGIFFSYENGTNGLKNLCLDAFLDYEYVTIPSSLDEQQAIATFLSEIDNKIAVNLRVSSNLEAQAQAIFKHWFIDFAPFKDGKFIESEIGMIPEGWKVGVLGEIAEFKRGKTITKADTTTGSVPVVAGGLEPAYFHDKSNTASRVITVSGSGANAGFTRMYYQPVWASDCSFVDSVSTHHLHTAYCYLIVNKKQVDSLQWGAAQPHVYAKDLNKLPFVVAPLEVLDAFEEIVSVMFDLIEVKTKEIFQLSSLRDTLLPKLMSGQIKL